MYRCIGCIVDGKKYLVMFRHIPSIATKAAGKCHHYGRNTMMMSSYVASIDQGTSSSRVILYDAETLAPKSSHQVRPRKYL